MAKGEGKPKKKKADFVKVDESVSDSENSSKKNRKSVAASVTSQGKSGSKAKSKSTLKVDRLLLEEESSEELLNKVNEEQSQMCKDIVEEIWKTAWNICSERFYHRNAPALLCSELRDTWLRMLEIEWMDQNNMPDGIPLEKLTPDEPPTIIPYDESLNFGISQLTEVDTLANDGGGDAGLLKVGKKHKKRTKRSKTPQKAKTKSPSKTKKRPKTPVQVKKYQPKTYQRPKMADKKEGSKKVDRDSSRPKGKVTATVAKAKIYQPKNKSKDRNVISKSVSERKPRSRIPVRITKYIAKKPKSKSPRTKTKMEGPKNVDRRSRTRDKSPGVKTKGKRKGTKSKGRRPRSSKPPKLELDQVPVPEPSKFEPASMYSEICGEGEELEGEYYGEEFVPYTPYICDKPPPKLKPYESWEVIKAPTEIPSSPNLSEFFEDTGLKPWTLSQCGAPIRSGVFRLPNETSNEAAFRTGVEMAARCAGTQFNTQERGGENYFYPYEEFGEFDEFICVPEDEIGHNEQITPEAFADKYKRMKSVLQREQAKEVASRIHDLDSVGSDELVQILAPSETMARFHPRDSQAVIEGYPKRDIMGAKKLEVEATEVEQEHRASGPEKPVRRKTSYMNVKEEVTKKQRNEVRRRFSNNI